MGVITKRKSCVTWKRMRFLPGLRQVLSVNCLLTLLPLCVLPSPSRRIAGNVGFVSTKPKEETKFDCKPDIVAGYPVQHAPDPQVLPGYGDPKTLPRLSKVQHIIIKKVAEEYGYLYPYIPDCLEEEIQDKEIQWIDEAVLSFLQIPLWVDLTKLSLKTAEKYLSVPHTWGYDHKINLDRVIIHRPNKADIQHYITTVNAKGETLKLPNPLITGKWYWTVFPDTVDYKWVLSEVRTLC